MYHVSTYLPFDKVNEQQLERKRHLGNDVCVLIYLDVDPKEEIDLTGLHESGGRKRREEGKGGEGLKERGKVR